MKLIKLFSPRGKKFYFYIWMLTGLRPRNLSLYRLALTHKSANLKAEDGRLISNERLEYLGDAVLGAIIATELYIRYPKGSEGFLTKTRSRIVSRSHLNEIASAMGLAQMLATNLQTDPRQTHVLGDALEALIGAVFLDYGFDECSKFINTKLIDKYIDIEKLIKKDTNYKSLLIEWAQKYKKSVNFTTEEHHAAGEHSPVFISNASVDGEKVGEGKGSSKKEAQQNAARTALENVTKG
jgi:ribonuclease-3